jgi:hypothetical protein
MDKLRKVVGIDLGTTHSVIALLDVTDSAFIAESDARGRSPDPEGSAQILCSLRDVLAATLKDGRYVLNAAVLTVPADSTPDQIAATRKSGELAGFEVVELLSEPEAAAFYHTWADGHAPATGPCAAFGAALRGARHGLRFLDLPGNLELHVTSPPRSAQTTYTLTGVVRGDGAAEMVEGGSVRVLNVVSGMVEEAFLDEAGGFAQEWMLEARCDNALEVTLCDSLGGEIVRLPFCVRHAETPLRPGGTVMPAPRDIRSAELAPWKSFARLVKDCLILAGDVAERTGRDRQELFEQVYAQERFAEQAFARHNAESYRECFDNLRRFLGYLQRLGSDHLPGAVRREGPLTVADARAEVHRLRNALTTLTSVAKSRRRSDLQERAAGLNARAEQLLAQAAADVAGTLREARQLWAEYAKVEEQLSDPLSTPDS